MPMSMSSSPQVVLDVALHGLRPLARRMLRNGVTSPAFGAALKRVFLDAAQAEPTQGARFGAYLYIDREN